MLYPVFAQTGWKQAVFLRAFRQDDLTHTQRELIHAALPPRTRLVGVRDPRQRTSLWGRFLFDGWTALRYVASSRFELEAANRNWLARLLGTLAKSRFVIIDLRVTTPHVGNEVRLCWMAGGMTRCLFLCDPSKSRDEWINEAAGIAQFPAEALREASFLIMPKMDGPYRDAQEHVAAMRARLAATPKGTIAVPAEALAFVRTKVKQGDWSTWWIETPAGSITIAVILGAACLVAVATYLSETGARLLRFGLVGLTFILLGVAASRMYRVAARQAQLGRQGGVSRLRSSLALGLTILLGCFAIIPSIMLSIASSRQNIFAEASMIAVRADIQMISTQLKLYENLNGFSPTTEQGLQALVAQPEVAPRPTRWMQFLTALPRDPWKTQYIYVSPGRRNPDGYDLYSAGPDRTPNTADDFWSDYESFGE